VPNAPSVIYDAVFIPGGNSVAELMTLPPVIAFISEMHCHGKPIAAAAEAEDLLAASQVPPEDADAEGVIRGKKSADDLIEGLVTALLQHRFPARQPETLTA
jgi:catalase